MNYFQFTTREKIGELHVDAGCMVFGDPCYFATPDCPNTFMEPWSIFCDKVLNGMDAPDPETGQPRQYTEFDPESPGTALIVHTGYGDGTYPVYVERKHGRILRIAVDFDPEPEDEEDGQ